MQVTSAETNQKGNVEIIQNIIVSGNESCPQPQTSEHLAAIEIMKLKHIVILQNKIDLVKEGQAKEQHEQIVKFVQGTVAEGAPIIPISAQLKYNIEVLCEYITKKIPVPVRDFTSEPHLIVIRSFDVNKPGCEVNDLKGGVAGGSILRGVLKVGQEIEVCLLCYFEQTIVFMILFLGKTWFSKQRLRRKIDVQTNLFSDCVLVHRTKRTSICCSWRSYWCRY